MSEKAFQETLQQLAVEYKSLWHGQRELYLATAPYYNVHYGAIGSAIDATAFLGLVDFENRMRSNQVWGFEYPNRTAAQIISGMLERDLRNRFQINAQYPLSPCRVLSYKDRAPGFAVLFLINDKKQREYLENEILEADIMKPPSWRGRLPLNILDRT